jgi:DNA-binding response OmpR family regulator
MSTETLHHIAVVDDDAGIRTLLVRILRESGYEATGAEDGAALRQLMVERPADLILLDIMLPGEDGLDLCRELRAQSGAAVIMISARGKEADRVAGLDVGADDYIAKPFGRSEVLARIRAVLRRASGQAAPVARPAPEQLTFAGWRYRPRQCELVAPSGAEVALTGAEHELLLALLRNPQRTIGRERLLELARGRLGHASDRSVDVLVSRLRRKMGDGQAARPMIHTVRGVGYMMAVEVEAH